MSSLLPAGRKASRRLATIAALLGVSTFMLAEAARADEPTHGTDRSTAAEDLFQRGKALLTQRDFAAACPMFAESYRLDPAGGTLQNLAVCYEELGKWASAYARFQELRAMSKGADHPRPDRVKLADEHIAKLLPRLSRVVVIVPAELGATAVVTLDGVTYLKPSWSTGIVADPGPHQLVVSAPGKQPFNTTVNVPNEARQQEVRVPGLADEAKAPPSNAPEQHPLPGPTKETHPLRTTGLVVGSVGLGILVAGGIFGALTFAKNADAKDRCTAGGNPSASREDFDPAGRCYTGSPAWSEANAMKDDARTLATVANVLVPVGVLSVGAGVFLFFQKGARTERATGSARLQVFPSLGGASLAGSF
jgi:hypothetical protein